MLATGGSAVAAINAVKSRGAKTIKLVCLVGVPEGVRAVQKAHPDVDIYLAAMIAGFQNACAYPVRVINIREFPFAGGCISCFHCAVSGKCIYQDGFDELLRNRIQSADAILMTG